MNPDPLRPADTDTDELWDPTAGAWVPRPSTLWAVLLGAAIGLVLGIVVTASVLAAAAPRGAPDVPAPALLGAPWVGSPGGAPTTNRVLIETDLVVPTQDPGELASAAVGGQATWYCSSSSPCTRGYRPWDLVAAIDPTLGIPKGARLRVDHDGRSVEVTVVDVCACGGERIVDLTSGAFVYLAPLSVGRIDVSIVVLGADVTPPATETQP